MTYRIIDTKAGKFARSFTDIRAAIAKADQLNNETEPERHIVRGSDYCGRNENGNVQWLELDKVTGATVLIVHAAERGK